MTPGFTLHRTDASRLERDISLKTVKDLEQTITPPVLVRADREFQ